jgi:hypothetical protein
MKTAAATLLALALAAPPATARPILDWGSAGIGAASTGGLALVAAAGLAAARRARFAS